MRTGMKLWAAGLVLLVSGCSVAGAIEKLAGPENVKLAFDVADQLCLPDPSVLKPRFAPELWQESVQMFPQAKQYCPNGPSKKRLMGFQSNSNTSTQGSSTRREFAVVSESAGKWTVTSFAMASKDGGPEQIIGWDMNSSAEKPKDLEALDAYDAALPTIRLIAGIVLALIVAAIGWFIIRRRKRAV